MFTDMVGFSAIMSRDNSRALNLLQANKKIHKVSLKKHNGQWLKEIGDGVLASFDTVTDAVFCAWDILQQAQDVEDLNLRIGLHLGEVEISGGDIYGDGVNIASRVESIAKSGKVFLSESIYNNIRNNSSIQTSFEGEHQLKNIPNPIRIFSIETIELSPAQSRNAGHNKKSPMVKGVLVAATLLALAASYFLIFHAQLGLEPNPTAVNVPPSIAVLAFQDMSPDKSQAYLSDGIAEEVIMLLSQVNGLKVVGRTSSFSFKNKSVDLKEIGQILNAGYILEGSVKKSGEKIRVTVRLNSSYDGSDIWSKKYEHELTDIFAIQDSIAREVVDLFELTLDLSRQENPPTNSIEAYEAYLRAREHYQSGLSGTIAAIEQLEKAMMLDPEFLEASALLAEIYWAVVLYNLGDRDEYSRKAKITAQNTISIDPDSYEGYQVLGFVTFAIDQDWNGSIESFRQAIEKGMPVSDPKYLSVITAISGETEKLVDELKALLKDDPLSVYLMSELSRAYLWNRDYQGVIENGQEVLKMDPDNTSIMRHMADAYLFSGDLNRALKAQKSLFELNPKYSPYGYIAALASTGNKEQAIAVLNTVIDDLNPAKKAFCYQYVGQLDSAFKYYNQGMDEKDFFLTLIQIEPHFDYVRQDSRYRSLISELDFPESENETIQLQ